MRARPMAAADSPSTSLARYTNFIPGMFRSGAMPADTSDSVNTGPLAFRNSVRSRSKKAAPRPMAARTLLLADDRQLLKQGLDLGLRRHVVPAGGDLAVGADQE